MNIPNNTHTLQFFATCVGHAYLNWEITKMKLVLFRTGSACILIREKLVAWEKGVSLPGQGVSRYRPLKLHTIFSPWEIPHPKNRALSLSTVKILSYLTTRDNCCLVIGLAFHLFSPRKNLEGGCDFFVDCPIPI